MNLVGYEARLFRYVRKRQGAALRPFAKKIGVSYTTLYRYEHGLRIPTRSALKKLVKISGFDSLKELMQHAL